MITRHARAAEVFPHFEARASFLAGPCSPEGSSSPGEAGRNPWLRHVQTPFSTQGMRGSIGNKSHK
jgi:hypothetical protein